MPNIIISPSEKSHGLIVFSHRELGFLRRYNFIIKRWKQKNKFVLALHYGWYHGEVRNLPVCVDLVLGSKSTVDCSDRLQLAYCSRDFIDRTVEAYRGNKNKYWDFVCVSNSHKNKRLDYFLNDVEKGITKNLYSLLILQVSFNSSNKHYIKNIIDRARELSNSQYFDFLPIAMDNGSVGLTRSTTFNLLSRSKVLTHYTSLEGESRIISEALELGLVVVASKGLVGGGLDRLSESNSSLWASPDESFNRILDALNIPINQNSNYMLEDFIRDLKTIPELAQFDVSNMVTDGLDFILPVQRKSQLNDVFGLNIKPSVFNYVYKL